MDEVRVRPVSSVSTKINSGFDLDTWTTFVRGVSNPSLYFYMIVISMEIMMRPIMHLKLKLDLGIYILINYYC